MSLAMQNAVYDTNRNGNVTDEQSFNDFFHLTRYVINDLTITADS